jgi:hypothetical protein
MSEGDWSSEARGLEKPKRRVPMWVWGCGGGCALVLLVGVILGVFVFRMGSKMVNQDKNWAEITQVLPVVQQPEGYVVVGMPVKFDGVQIWILSAKDQTHQVTLFHGPGGDGTEDTRKELFGTDSAGRAGAEPGTLVVGGRTLRVLRHRTIPGQEGPGSGGGFREAITKAIDGSNLTAELSLPDSPELIAVTYTRQGVNEPVRDEEVLAFLKHFRVPGTVAEPVPPVDPTPPPPADGEKRDG